MKKTSITTIGLIIKSTLVLLLFFTSCKDTTLEESKTYYENGNLKSVEYLNERGNKEGENKYYTEEGILSYITTFKNGNPLKTLHFYEDGKLRYSSELKQKDTIKAINYFKDGKVKTMGNLINDIKVGWWSEYLPDGKLDTEYEYLSIDGKEYLNQIKVYNGNGKIRENESSFFVLNIPDTIQMGKNAGNLNYYSTPTKDSERHLYVIIDNEYEGGIIKKDTFFIEKNQKNRFGIYAYKLGFLKVKGTILDRELYEIKRDKNSFGLEFKDCYKYFEKEVYVKDKK